ncbi:MAG: electron transport complex subunit RsxC [Gammaproteobacteria bacterium]|nr:electron transport complex subunit RsxC [Gammaproteobacteria bacterium]
MTGILDTALGGPSFRHGIHPRDHKDDTCGLAIRQFPFAPVLIVPLRQHLGAPAVAVVRAGQEVARGQTIATPDGFMSVAMHAPVSGVVQKIDLAPTISGEMVESVFIEPLPASTQEIDDGEPCDLATASATEIMTAIQNAGIVGLGGAAFPTHAKLRFPDDKHVETLIINGVECEPYLTTDHRVMLEQTADIYSGIRYLINATKAAKTVIAVEANKRDAITTLERMLPADLPVSVAVLKVKYPQGAEKILIKALLGREVPQGGLPIDVGVLCTNVATTAEIGRLLPHGRGIQERVITIAGPGVEKKGNYLIPIGTPVRFALEACGADPEVTRVFMGGPMMGPAVSNLDIPVTKGTSGILAFTTRETEEIVGRTVYPCIRCSRCVDACPVFLNPSQLGLLAKQEVYDRMADQFHLFDCFECGSCTYVCPSHIPLVQYFRVAKKMVRKTRATH